jgi:hypothetical protein
VFRVAASDGQRPHCAQDQQVDDLENFVFVVGHDSTPVVLPVTTVAEVAGRADARVEQGRLLETQGPEERDVP